jgi:proteic killer suppression protein
VPTYRDRKTERFAAGEFVREFYAFERPAERKLRMLYVATSLNDLRAIPGNRLEKLAGDRRGQYSIRINGQYQIYFEWPDDETGAQNIEVTDYH